MLPFLVLAACTGGPPNPPIDAPPAVVTRPVPYAPTAFPFARRGSIATVVVPASSRPGGAPAPERFHPVGSFRSDKGAKSAAVWKIPLPVHSNLFPMRERGTHIFGNYAPPGLHVYGPDGEFEQNRTVRTPGQYAFDREYLYVGTPPEADAPDPASIDLVFDKATAMENALNQGASGLSSTDFVFRTLTLDESSHTGLLLPAPASVSWPVRVPSSGAFVTRGTVLPPAIHAGVSSDGASLVLRVDVAGSATEVGRWPLEVEAWREIRADLSRWANQEVTVTLATEPGGNPVFDYVFLEEPVLYTPSEHPKRLLLVFIDTLRRDHVGTYGYARPTTPKLDGWAKHAAVFEDARTVAPWTLPSARAVLSGAEPELWYEVDPLPERLADAGFQTEAVVTNAFLSQTFDMHAGWSRYDYFHEKAAPEVTELMLERIGSHRDRDVALMMHLMEPHIPYDEPDPYRTLFAGARPAEIEETSRRELMKVRPGSANFEAVKQYVLDRYDQNIRVVDDEVARVIGAMGPDATVVVFSDHGEEFWDHGAFEHGHAFGDELLRVPLLVRGPSVQAGRLAAQASLLDITPTVLELLGLPAEVRSGKSLVPAIWGGDDADRPRAFGRPLYGPAGNGPSLDGWGVVADGHKWWQRGGDQRLYDLRTDPGEATDQSSGPTEAWAAAMATALGREVVPAWRVVVQNGRNILQSELSLSAPGGIADAWHAYDPRGEYAGTPVVVVDGVARMVQRQGNELPPAIYVRPTGDPRHPAGLELRLATKKLEVGGLLLADGAAPPPEGNGVAVFPAPAEVDFSRASTPFLTVGDAGWGATVELVWVPVPTGVAVAGYSPEMRQELIELGYLQP